MNGLLDVSLLINGVTVAASLNPIKSTAICCDNWRNAWDQMSCHLQNVFDPADRDEHPTRPMIEFIPDFVNGFVE